MKLKALDQIHISSVSSETLAPGAEFHVSDAAGRELLKHHPAAIVLIEDEENDVDNEKAASPAENKSAGPAPENKNAPSKPAGKPAARRNPEA